MKRLAALVLLAPLLAVAHEVPDDVRLRVFLKPSHDHMQILVRVPVNALIDFLFPTLADSNFLDLPGANQMTADAAKVWVSDLLTIHEGDTPLARPQILKVIVSRDSDPSFASYAEALAHINGAPLPDNALVAWDRAVLDVLLETPIQSQQGDFSLTPRFGRLGVRVTNDVAFLPARGGQRNFEYEGDPEPFHLDPTAWESASHFFGVGFHHILDETDHLLFLFCVVLLFRRVRSVFLFAIGFTAAHSVILLVSALTTGLGPVWLPRVSGTLMALSVIYLGLECVVPATPARFRAIIAIGSGMVFGSGFWFFLERVFQFGGDHPVVSAMAFNAGIEAGQYLALALMIAAAALFFHFTALHRMWTMIFAGLAAHVAWHRMTERAFTLSQVPWQWPTGEVWAALLAATAVGVIAAQRSFASH